MAIAAQYATSAAPIALRRLADNLGVSATSLARLDVGWSAEHGAWTFPMSDAAGNVIGIRLRFPNGRKLSVRGGHEGLFIPSCLTACGPLLVAEGPTDTAALLDLGFNAIGRPSCTGGIKHVVELVQRRKLVEVVVVADCDRAGRHGAEKLASMLLVCSAPRVIMPPAGSKDARDWKYRGATRRDVEAVIDATPVRRLAIRVKHGGHRNG